MKIGEINGVGPCWGQQVGHFWVGLCGKWPMADVVIREATQREVDAIREFAEIVYPSPLPLGSPKGNK